MTEPVQTSFDRIDASAVAAYREHGAICLRGAFADWIDALRAGVERNRAEPGPYFADNVAPGGDGRFWDDYCNWRRIPEFERFVLESDAAGLAAAVMASRRAQFFHDHVLVKEAATSKPTPWHQDAPYYFVAGSQTVSFWLPLDPVAASESLRLVAGSHRWPKPLLPVKWLDDADFYAERREQYMTMPDVDGGDSEHRVLQWQLQPGDAVLFHFRTVHGARGNPTARRRRAFSMRWLGDDCRYRACPGRSSPPFPGHGMRDGERLREDWFPVLWPRPAA